MTLKQIRAMFQVGQKWTATRTGPALTINGNAGTSVLAPNNVAGEVRTVDKVGSSDLVWTREGSDKRLFTKWPLASEILEARDGYLKFGYDNGVVVELLRA